MTIHDLGMPIRSVMPIEFGTLTSSQCCEEISSEQMNSAMDWDGLPSQMANLGPTNIMEQISPLEWLDATVDNECELEKQTTREIVVKLIKEAMDHKSFPALFKLKAVKNFFDLLEKYKLNLHIQNPCERASAAIVKSVGRGPYFSQQIQHLSLYIGHFHALPTTGSGKHHAHPSLLNDKHIAQAVQHYLTVVSLGEVRSCH